MVSNEPLEGPRKHYIPHHAVVTPTTKVRVVYETSAKAKQTNLSLNESLHRGPVMLPWPSSSFLPSLNCCSKGHRKGFS